VTRPNTEEQTRPEVDEQGTSGDEGPYVVILYNDDCHEMAEVAIQVQKATGYAMERCVSIMLEAHARGRAIAFTGSEQDCERVAAVLRQIRLQVETDKF
jgi:ATP-dependent Clp protease adapter protein ClpS